MYRDDRALQRPAWHTAPAFERREALGQRGLGAPLNDRIEAREDLQAFVLEVLLTIDPAQLAPHYLGEGREADGHAGCARRDTERCAAQELRVPSGEHALLGHARQHIVAALEGAARMAARVVQRRAAHHAGQEGQLRRGQLGERSAEIELRGEPEAMDRARPVLAEIDLVDIGLEDLLLAVTQLQQERHECLADLAPQCALGIEIKVFDELLGQGAAALPNLARTQVFH